MSSLSRLVSIEEALAAAERKKHAGAFKRHQIQLECDLGVPLRSRLKEAGIAHGTKIPADREVSNIRVMGLFSLEKVRSDTKAMKFLNSKLIYSRHFARPAKLDETVELFKLWGSRLKGDRIVCLNTDILENDLMAPVIFAAGRCELILDQMLPAGSEVFFMKQHGWPRT